MKFLKKISNHTELVDVEGYGKSFLTRCEDGRHLLSPLFTGDVFEAKQKSISSKAMSADFSGEIRSPSQGKLIRVQALTGQVVEKGMVLFAVEVMKMTLEIRSPQKILIQEVRAQVGDFVNNKQVIIKAKKVEL